jgi:GDP-4-dehydro-6-deoxy-D-mannose reductase
VKALVTGARGFVGHHLVAHLTAAGDDVVGVDRDSGGPDLVDGGSWKALLGRERPEAVYHLAAQASVANSWADPVATFRVNAEGTLNVLQGCVAADVRRVLVVSSADVYGAVHPDELPLRETNPIRPVTPYAASKAAAEAAALQAHYGHHLGVVVARSFNHLGPGQDDRFVAGALAQRIAINELTQGDEVPVGNLTAKRDFTDVRDVVRAYRLLIEAGEAGTTYHVCSGVALAVAELADRLLAAAERPMRLVTRPELMRPVDVPMIVGDAGRITDATGWRPQIPLSETLGDLLDAARARLRAR